MIKALHRLGTECSADMISSKVSSTSTCQAVARCLCDALPLRPAECACSKCEFSFLNFFLDLAPRGICKLGVVLRFLMAVPTKTPLVRYAELVKFTDEDLMLHLQVGHHDALAVLYDRYHRLVMSIALRILRDSGEAEDLMQSVFLEIFRSAAQFDPARGTTKVGLLQFAYHRSFNRRQYLALRGLYERPDEHREVVTLSGAGNSKAFAGMESSHLVRKALGSLGAVQRKILELAFYEGLTMKEISERTGETFDSVRHGYYRGLEKLRLLLCKRPETPLREGERVPHVEP